MGNWTLATCSYSEWHPDMGAMVRITLGNARGKTPDFEVPDLAPRRAYFNAPTEEFIRKYRLQLNAYGVPHFQQIFTTMTDIASGAPLVLCCFERLNRQGECHRRDFACWWYENTGEDIPELGAKPIRPAPHQFPLGINRGAPKPPTIQPDLFDEG